MGVRPDRSRKALLPRKNVTSLPAGEFLRPGGAILAEGLFLQVNPLDGVRAAHHAAVVVAVMQLQGVSQLVDALDE